MRDGLPLGEDLGQVLGAQHVPQRRRREEAGRVAGGRKARSESFAQVPSLVILQLVNSRVMSKTNQIRAFGKQ